MARSIQQINQDLAAIEERVASLAVELKGLYTQYLNSLSQAAQKQLILASYQICTQIYPESFLQLSFSERQKLQETLREIGKTILPELLNNLDFSLENNDISDLNIMEQMLLPASDSESSDSELSDSEPSDSESEVPQPSPPQEDTQAKTIETLDNPEELLYWAKQVEIGIREELERISKETNQLLQNARILPSQLPAKVLEIAMQAEEEGGTIGSAPNLLNLLVETDREDDKDASSSQSHQITKLTAIHLRLSEMEFADPTLSLERKQIRSFLENISKIREQYRQKQREKAVAEAEAAWRASWYEA